MAKNLTKDEKTELLENKYNSSYDPELDYISTAHGRRRDRNAIKQSNEAQFHRNKANFLTGRTMFKKSELAKGFESGRLKSKDLGEVNKIFAESAKNKATMIKNITKKARRNKK